MVVAELVASPDVEGMIIAHLKPALVEVPVSTIFPKDGSRAVRVSATGGTVTGRVVASSRVLVECWDTSTSKAQRLAAQVHALMTSWEGGVYRVEADLPTNYQDVNRMDLFRYQFMATVWSRMVHD